MYPDLSYFFHDVFGTEVDNWLSIFKTFGFFLVLAILSAAAMLYSELKRKAANGTFRPTTVEVTEGKGAGAWELFSNALFGFILGFKGVYIAQDFSAFQADPAAVVLSGLGNWPAGIIGALLFAGYKYWIDNRKKLPEPRTSVVEVYPHDRIGDITMIAAIAGVVGAKIFAIIEDLPAFFADPIGTFFSGSGLAIYGGLIGGFLGVYLYLRNKNAPMIHVLDAVAPALLVAYGVGRLGCHFSGDGDWGIAAAAQPDWWFLPDWLWSYNYPRNVVNDGTLLAGCDPDQWSSLLGNRSMTIEEKCKAVCGIRYCHELSPAVYPTSVYESIMAITAGGILWALRKRVVIPGLLFFSYLIFNGIERFSIERIRVNTEYDVAGSQLTQAQLIALALILIGVVGGLYVWRRAKKAV